MSFAKSSPFGKPKFRKVECDHLPGPIATAYRRIFTRHERDVERLIFVCDTAEGTARFLAAVVLCALRELAQQEKLQPPLIDLGDPSMRLKKPSFGLWMEILREGARKLMNSLDLIDDEDSKLFATHLCQFVFNEQQKMKGRPYQDLDAIVVIRNQLHHPSEELDIPTACENAENLINSVLEKLQFFEDFPVYVVKQIVLEHRRGSSPKYDHQCFMLTGEIDFPSAVSDARPWHTETNEVIVHRGESSYLNLDPMFVNIQSDDIDKSKLGSGKNAEELNPGMYSFAGFASKSSGLVVDYLPCSSSSSSFRTSNQAFSDPDLTGYLNQGVAEFLELLRKAPTTEEAETE